jgi:hypothetical protein
MCDSTVVSDRYGVDKGRDSYRNHDRSCGHAASLPIKAPGSVCGRARSHRRDDSRNQNPCRSVVTFAGQPLISVGLTKATEV